MTQDDRIRFTLRLPGQLFDKLRAQAEQMGISINSLILQILWDWAEGGEE